MNIKTIFKLANEWQDKLPGGLADNKTPQNFKPESLEKGIKVELEHTNDRHLAKEIAMDHLTEDPDYYLKLEKMEKKAQVLENEPMPSPEDIERELGDAIRDLRRDLFLGAKLGEEYKNLHDYLDNRGFDVSNAPEIFGKLKYGLGQRISEFREPNVKERIAQVIRFYEALQESIANQPTELEEFDF